MLCMGIKLGDVRLVGKDRSNELWRPPSTELMSGPIYIMMMRTHQVRYTL